MIKWKTGQNWIGMVQGTFLADNQLPTHFWLNKSISNSNFLFALNKQAGVVYKTAKTLSFQKEMNLVHCTKVCPISQISNFDFWKLRLSLTFMNFWGIFDNETDVISYEKDKLI